MPAKTDDLDGAVSDRTQPRTRQALIWGGGIALIATLAVAVILAFFDWNLIRDPIARLASARLGRQVQIEGNLRVHLWSLKPNATIENLRIGNPAWAGPGQTATFGRVVVQVELLPLLRGRKVLSRLELQDPVINLRRDLQGRASWDFSNGRSKAPVRLPAIRRLIVEGGLLNLLDERRKLTLKAQFSAMEVRGSADHGFHLSGQGVMNGADFRLTLGGGPLLNIDPDKPYPFTADIRAGPTRVRANGALATPFDFGHLTVDLSAGGGDLGDLYDLTGIPFPNTPPYQLKGRLVRTLRDYRIDNLSGRVGDSDISGRLAVSTAKTRPYLSADLRTRSLDFDDLAAIFGGPPSTGSGETASPTQVAMSRSMNAQRRLLPDATLKVARIRALDADVRYRVTSIHDAILPLRAADVTVKLDQGLLIAQPLVFDLPQGRISGRIGLDARPAVPITDVDISVSNARLEQLIPIKDTTAGGGQPFTGALVGRIKLRGVGDSVHRAAAHANGQVSLIVPQGQIRRAFAELIGIDLTKGLGLLFAKNQETTPIRCAIADFKAVDGLLVADHLVFDTGPVLGTGHGTVDLGRERIDFTLRGQPKQFRLVRIRAPIRITGPITAPKVGIEKSGALMQGGIAAILAAVASPLAAVLPFVSPGLAKDAPCGALIAQAGRPSKTVAPIPRRAG